MIKFFFLNLLKLSNYILSANVAFLIYSGFTGAALHGRLGLVVAISFFTTLIVFIVSNLTEIASIFDSSYTVVESPPRGRDEAARAAIAEQQQRTMIAWWVNHNRY